MSCRAAFVHFTSLSCCRFQVSPNRFQRAQLSGEPGRPACEAESQHQYVDRMPKKSRCKAETAPASTFSLFAVKQSHGCLERLGDASSILSPQLNADGFGVSWYDRTSADPCIPAVYTSTSPAWNDSNLFKIGEVLAAQMSDHLIIRMPPLLLRSPQD